MPREWTPAAGAVTDGQPLVAVGAATVIIVFAGLMDSGHVLPASCVLAAGLMAALFIAVRAYVRQRAADTAEMDRQLPQQAWTDEAITELQQPAAPPTPAPVVDVDLEANTATVRKPSPHPRTPAPEPLREPWNVDHDGHAIDLAIQFAVLEQDIREAFDGLDQELETRFTRAESRLRMFARIGAQDSNTKQDKEIAK